MFILNNNYKNVNQARRDDARILINISSDNADVQLLLLFGRKGSFFNPFYCYHFICFSLIPLEENCIKGTKLLAEKQWVLRVSPRRAGLTRHKQTLHVAGRGNHIPSLYSHPPLPAVLSGLAPCSQREGDGGGRTAASAFYLILTPEMRWCSTNIRSNRSQRKIGAWLALFTDPEKHRLLIMIPFVSITDMQIYVITTQKTTMVPWEYRGNAMTLLSQVYFQTAKRLSYHLRPDCIVCFLMSLTNSPKSYVRHTNIKWMRKTNWSQIFCLIEELPTGIKTSAVRLRKKMNMGGFPRRNVSDCKTAALHSPGVGLSTDVCQGNASWPAPVCL